MNNSAKWIWLDKEHYPMHQKSEFTYYDKSRTDYKFVVADFKYSKLYSKKITKAVIGICADVKFWLYVNGKFVGLGPVCQGGDYANTKPMPVQYYNTYETEICGNSIDFYVSVQKNITVQCDMSKGKPGLIMSAELYFDDGTKETIVTDDSWQCRINNSRYAVGKTDYTLCDDEWHNAEITESIWNLKKAPIEMLHEEEILPMNFSPIAVKSKQTKEITLEFDKIYSCYYCLSACCEDKYSDYTIQIAEYEKEEKKANIVESVKGKGKINFRSLGMHSAGAVKLLIVNDSSKDLYIDKFSIRFCHYPITAEGSFECSDSVLNDVYKLGKHALKICRQTIELDSPNHQENLGCTGDYFIASLMNYFTYGDTALTRLDIVRTADYIEMTDGYMFHTTYSMIWILMLYDYYMFTADNEIFKEAYGALTALLERFHSYTDERGIIVNPDSYMFVDWLEADGMSMHHPPAALGQAVLNAFYYGGLMTAVKIFEIIKDKDSVQKYSKRAETLKKAFNELFYDKERKLYFDGLNEKGEVRKYLPENVDKRYFSWHTNSLAVLFDIAPSEIQADIMERILNDMSLINPQPYFMHFVFEAIDKAGIFDKYGIEQLLRWKQMAEFPKGLQEGWYDMSGYGFDYSHVWGGTPTYQLPSKLMGFEMIEPGFKKIKLNPMLYGLDYAKIKMPTPYGYITVNLFKDKETEIIIPKEIELVKGQ